MANYVSEGLELAGCPTAPGCMIPCDGATGGLGIGPGGCLIRPVMGLGAFSLDSLGLGFNLKTVAIVTVVAFAGSWVLRKTKLIKNGRRRRSRRRNAPFRVSWMQDYATEAPARRTYSKALPKSGYGSVRDLGRGGSATRTSPKGKKYKVRYSTRRIAATGRP